MKQPMKYTSTLANITAIQWTGDNLEECQEFLGTRFYSTISDHAITFTKGIYHDIVGKGNYIIRDDRGEYCTCNRDIFEETYILTIEDDKIIEENKVTECKYLPHQQRVINEREELNVKIDALDKFISADNFKTIIADLKEQFRLQEQLRIMKEYLDVLNERISNF